MPDPFATPLDLDALTRAPDIEAPNLKAYDGTDRLLLRTAADRDLLGQPGTVVLGDRYGALTLGALAAGAREVRVFQDSLAGERALARNAEKLGIAGFRSLGLGEELLAGARTVLWQLPKSLAEIRDQAMAIARWADPTVAVLAGARVKYLTRPMGDVLAESFEQVHAELAAWKSRLLVAIGPRPDPTWRLLPAEQRHDGLILAAYGGVFAGTAIDIGTRFLFPQVGAVLSGPDGPPQGGRAIDLGCGSGVLTVELARRRPDLAVLGTDVSRAAVASTRATVLANGLILAEAPTPGAVEVRQDIGLASCGAGEADLVVCNPPFHVGAAVQERAAAVLFEHVARVLRPGGKFLVVHNSHLRYRPTIERVIGPARQLDRNAKFTVLLATRR